MDAEVKSTVAKALSGEETPVRPTTVVDHKSKTYLKQISKFSCLRLSSQCQIILHVQSPIRHSISVPSEEL
jgi:hypothetical protein